MIESNIALDRASKIPIYQQIYHILSKQIMSGDLEEHVKLTSVKGMMKELKVSRTTVENAYLQLMSEGYIYSKPSSGYYVAHIDQLIHTKTKSDEVALRPFRSIHIDTTPYTYNFKPGSVDAESFPFKKWNRLSSEVMSKENKNILTHSDPRGEPSLREELSKYLSRSRGVTCSPDQIIIGAGTQTLIGILCRVFRDSLIKRVMFEEPGFFAARTVFENHNFEVIPNYLNENGFDTSVFRNDTKKYDLVFTTPSNQHPVGMILPICERIQLLNDAYEKDTYVIEDDYDSEFRYDVSPVPSLYSLDQNNRVIYLGTFSKTLFPAMHISYMVLPEKLMNEYIKISMCMNQTASKIHQDTITEFMKAGFFEQHIRKMRTVYAAKQDLMTNGVKNTFGDRVEIFGCSSGLNIALRIKNGMDESALIASAKAHDVKVYPLSLYYAHPPKEANELLLGYGHLSLQAIEEATRLLGKAWL